MGNVSWSFLVIIILIRLLHKEVLSGDYIIDINIKLNEQRIKYGGTEFKKEAYMERKEKTEEVRKEKMKEEARR